MYCCLCSRQFFRHPFSIWHTYQAVYNSFLELVSWIDRIYWPFQGWGKKQSRVLHCGARSEDCFGDAISESYRSSKTVPQCTGMPTRSSFSPVCVVGFCRVYIYIYVFGLQHSSLNGWREGKGVGQTDSSSLCIIKEVTESFGSPLLPVPSPIPKHSHNYYRITANCTIWKSVINHYY